MDNPNWLKDMFIDQAKPSLSKFVQVQIGNVGAVEDDIPRMFFGGALQQIKTEAIIPFRYISKTQDISGYVETKAQGNSSMSYPKKNQTIKLFKDAECTEKLKVDFRGWGKQNKFCLKANWIDISHARNVVSARLWADVVKSRSSYNELPELLRTSPNQGAVDGFPIKVYANGIYQGRYTLNIPKDKWTFNMDDDLDEHCVLCGENYASGCFRASANIDESDWTDEIHDIVPTSIKTRWNEVISFVMNSTDDEFKTNLGNYFDVDSLIDYHLFGLQSCGLDAYGKNQLYATYDGQKWIACMYDMDSTWGLYWNGSQFVATDYARTDYEDYASSGSSGDGNLLYIRLEQLFYEELKARWVELKSSALSVENIINRFERFTDIASAELVKEDYASTTAEGKFTGIPSKTTNNIQQIRAFAIARQAWTDEYVNALNGESGGGEVEPEEPDEPTNGLLYSLPTETTFDGTSNYIDTGVKLFDIAKDFTILLDADLSQENQNSACVFHCINEDASSWRGLNFCNNVGKYDGYFFGGSGENIGFANSIPRASRIKVAVTFVSGIATDIRYKTDNDDMVICTVNTANYKTHDYNLLIGAYQDTSGNKGRFWNGTLYDFKVYGEALTEDEITTYLNATDETHTHNYTSSVTTEATCDTDGVRTYTCSCGDSYTEKIIATGHKYTDGVCTACGEEDEFVMYKLAKETTFNGTSDYIDTGLQLANTDIDFTILFHATALENDYNAEIFHCEEEVSPYYGYSFLVTGSNDKLYRASCSNASYLTVVPSTDSTFKIALTHTAGVAGLKVKCLYDGDYYDVSNTGKSASLETTSRSLLLGCYLDENGNTGRYWNGTLHDFTVYNRVLSDDEIHSYFGFIGEAEEVSTTWSETAEYSINDGTVVTGKTNYVTPDAIAVPDDAYAVRVRNINDSAFTYQGVARYTSDMTFIDYKEGNNKTDYIFVALGDASYIRCSAYPKSDADIPSTGLVVEFLR